MKTIGLIIFLLFTINSCFSQPPPLTIQEQSKHKGDFYFYWGWNWGWYTKSTIDFKGNDYDFTLTKVRAKDRQSQFKLDYFNPSTATIPQYNFRVGYFITDKYSLTLGIDHMKYVVQLHQMVKIDGHIVDTGGEFDGEYANENIEIRPDFLLFEHTDGLNYINAELRHLEELTGSKQIKLSLVKGLGAGVLLPKTNVTILGSERHDEFHLSGFGISALLGANVAFGRVFFFQTEWKGGYFNMPDIRTTNSQVDSAKQAFFFSQLNIVFGANLRSKKNR